MKSDLRFTFAWIVSLLILASCSSEEITTGLEPVVKESGLKYMEFTASAGADTRTQLTSDNKVEWVAGDEISIFDGTANRKFTTKDSGTNAIFGGEAKETTTYYALYPYQEGATIEGNIIKNVVIPTVQEAKAGSFDGGVNFSVASASTDLQLAFKNVGSLVKFSMSNDKAADVRSVKLTSNNGDAVLAGTVNITVGATPSVTPVSSQNQVTLKSDAGFEVGVDYYLMVLPGTLSDGFSLTFTDKDGLTWQKTYTVEATMNRSNILKLNAIELGTFTTGLLTNVNLIAAAEASSGQSFIKNADGTVSLLNPANQQIVNAVTNLGLSYKNDPTICDEIALFPELEYLDCGENGIVSLDLSNNLKLKALYCNNNTGGVYNEEGDYVGPYTPGKLANLNITNNINLTSLSVQNNQLTSIDISNNKELISLYCNYNQLSQISLSNNNKLENLNCRGNQLTSIDVLSNTALYTLDCSLNKIETLDLSHNLALVHLFCSGSEINDHGDIIGTGRLKSIDVSKNTLLRSLYVDKNKLTELDVSNNINLVNFDCGTNNLTSINVNNNLSLEWLGCYKNKLTQLDVTNNTRLIELWCGINQIEELDITKNTNMETLICYWNNISTLNLTKCTSLELLWSNDCHISELDISNNNNLTLQNVFVGHQLDEDGNIKDLSLFVNINQYGGSLPDSGENGRPGIYEHANDNVIVLVKSDATHEDYTESDYGE